MFNILEGAVAVILVNARHVKAVKGRKADMRDCEWLADLLRHGLPKASFIPTREIRELRELTRYREGLVSELTALSNRIQEGPQKALEGRLSPTQRWLLRELLRHFDEATTAVKRVEEQIDQEIRKARAPLLSEAIVLLDSIPGLGESTAESIISEIGVDMTRLPTVGHLASWAGMCPGNDESAWAASHTKDTYLSALCRRLVRRIGKKKALVAMAHRMLVIVYHVLAKRLPYRELPRPAARSNSDRQQKRLIKKLEDLGLKVTIEKAA